MHRRTEVHSGWRLTVGSLLAGVALVVAAQQDATEVVKLDRVEVTGSHIYRADVETALPVQVLTRDDIARSGSTTVAEVMAKISANVGAFNDALSIGNQTGAFPRPGLSSVNLRGIGDGSTLVMINGRRVANYAFDGGAVDVNSIPVAAIDRVEILKDGASAIYGTDAIAGVVNFILRNDYQGVEVTGYGGLTQQGGGNQYLLTALAGYGNLARDRFNVFASVNYQKDEVLRAADRDFARTGYRPDAGLRSFSTVSFPANITSGRQLFNPAFASGCAPPAAFPVSETNGQFCGFDTSSLADLLPPVERTSVLGRATFQLNADLQLFAEAGYAYNKFALTLQPTPIRQRFTSQLEPFFYPAGGPFYPVAFAAANGLSGDLDLSYRTLALGNRVNDVDTQALRAVVGADGSAGGWDYGVGALYSRNQQSDKFASGYASERRLIDAMATGLINPFGPSGPEGDALLASTQVYGDYHDATGSTWLVDAKASRAIARLPTGPLAIALGAETRRETLENTFSPLVNSGDVLAAGGDHHSLSGSRNVWAIYVEASVPIATGFESQLAARYDHYSDFGGTANPKIALRWTPVKMLLLRTSWGTGFRAPTIYDLYTPLQHTFTGSLLPDPVRCPVTGLPEDCSGEFAAVVGGNPNLKPETSEQLNAGVVWEPVAGLSLTLDYWKINKRNVIGGISDADVLGYGAAFGPSNIIRGPVDPAYPDLPGPIETVILQNENIGSLRTSGIDVDISWRGPATSIGRFTLGLNGTYISTFKLQPGNGDYVSLAGNNDGPYAVPRWRHYASLNWSRGPWSATVAQTYQNSYQEADQRYCDDVGNCPVRRRVGVTSVWNIQGQYTGFRNATVAIGVKNLFDRDPPFAQWNPGFQAGYDVSYTDPRGRSFYTQLNFVFR